MVVCKLSQVNPCSGVDVDDVCGIFSPAGVLARTERFKACAYQDIRAKRVVLGKARVNPLKASKKASA